MGEIQSTFTTQDGVELFYRYRPARSGSTNKVIVLFHRGHEHSGRMMFIADELGLDDFSYFAWDARGHGHSPGARGDSPSLSTSVSDIQAFIDHIHTQYHISIENIAVIAQSVGAVLVSAWLHDYAPKIRCAVLASPALKVKLYVPFARSGLKLMQKIRGNFFVKSYVKAHYLTHDSTRIESYNNDPLIAPAISVRILLGLYDAADRVVADAAAITTPIQMLISSDDWVVHHEPQHRFFNHLGSHIKERHIFDGFYHDTLGEHNRALALSEVSRFISERFNEPLNTVDCTQADTYGVTRIESDELASPLSVWTPRGAYWALQKALIQLGAKWSTGLKLGQETGFDSGSTLDYIYQNRPEGVNGLGKAIDGLYLKAVGWRGIRQRKIHLQQLIQEAMTRLRANNQPVHVLDIAAGHGRYILDALTSADLPDSIQLRDYDEQNVRAGSALIAERGLSHIATFSQADAFDRLNYTHLTPTPTLGIVSGLHELFPNNHTVMQSLLGLGDRIESGHYLIYTGQPWHPQLEMIARCLTSHRQGQAWVMRRRTQQEMDQLVEKAGFKKIKQLIDEDGIFTVSLAIKT